MKNKTILIVDAFSGGKLFAEIATKEFGCTNIHLLSNKDLPDYYQSTFDPTYFSETLIWQESKRESIINKLKILEVAAVIAGTESGVQVADEVCYALGLTGNGLEKSQARRSKFLMHQYVSQAGLRIPLQKLTSDLNVAREFVEKELHFPIVIKPDSSAGSDGFNLVDDMVSFEAAFESLIMVPNRLGILNQKILIQEFIQGEEYAINTITSHGQHFVTHIWHYHKQVVGKSKIYDWEEYVNPNSAKGKIITEFVFKTLDSLDIQFGAAHTEIMMDSQGPVLIETASRVDGVCNPELDQQALGVNQIYLAILSVLHPELLADYYKKHFQIKNHLANVSLISNRNSERPLKKMNLAQLQALESFHSIRWFIKVGDCLKLTKDIFSSPGFIYLQHTHKDHLYEDYQKIRALENSNLLFEE